MMSDEFIKNEFIKDEFISAGLIMSRLPTLPVLSLLTLMDKMFLFVPCRSATSPASH